MESLIRQCGCYVFTFLLVWVVTSCQTSSPKVSTDERRIEGIVKYLENKEIEFSRGRYGLEAKLVGKIAMQVYQEGKKASDMLYQALRKENQFIAAHVLLTYIHKGTSFPITATHWNRLRVDFDADNKPIIDQAQIPSLVEYWKRELYPELVVPITPK